MEKVILIIRDGWGYRDSDDFNAISKADTPVDDKLMKEYPWTLLKASGRAVGLPDGYQGNSEVGHLTIGSGQIIEQSLVRVNKSIEDGSFFKKEELLGAIENCKENNSSLHIAGLLQKEGVHSHINHLFALLELCKKENFKDVYVHIITDGRDAPVNMGKNYIKELLEKMNSLEVGKVATISGRYYAMDRDKRWERTRKAYETVIQGFSEEKFDSVLEKVEELYNRGETDEFIKPLTSKDYSGVKDGDSFIFYNIRTDRPRQLTQALVEEDFKEWEREIIDVFFVAMTEYYTPMNGRVVFKEKKIDDILGEVLSLNKVRQLRVSETEKYPHVTFFFNGQREEPFKGEDRIIIPSPKVATYDQKPEMSVVEVALETKKQIERNKYQFILINLVNADMVGHTGEEEAIIKAVEAIDKAVGEIIEVGKENNYTILVFADHGNAEDQREEVRTSHTTNPVPLILVSDKMKNVSLKKGELKDIAPMTLALMGLKKPEKMTGEILWVDKKPFL
ncbi:MAG: 2,3-bisphosphoglycerate-independent phosphoglycerate mutase [Candidatus Pacebacteria bacterium]|nr:2,3-bisphosphoglycerate-independent phosphoglycerate mutase [Candidatus Paceibacterota bacterium]